VKPYRLSQLANAALDEIADDNPAAAERVIEALWETFDFLSGNPKSGKRRDDLRAGLRVFPARRPAHSYVVLYYETEEFVEINSVVHGARNWELMASRGDFDE
jgi:plasmid stabilization system protein ParE